MTEALMIRLDPDLAGHLAVAIHRHRDQLTKLGLAEPLGLADLETLAVSVTKSQEESRGFTVPRVLQDDLHAREYFTRTDVSRHTGTSLSTVDRWIRNGTLPSSKHGRVRRISRKDVERLLAAAA